MQKLDIESAELRNGNLMLSVPIWQAAKWLQEFKPGSFDITPHREKRSLNANAYCWKLCGMISEALRDGSTDVDIYRRTIKSVGVAKDFEDIRVQDSKTLMAAWNRLGLGWPAEILDYSQDGNHVTVRCWYGSSTYSVKQMSRLINHLVQDARSLGIETLEDEQLDSLIKEWNTNGK